MTERGKESFQRCVTESSSTKFSNEYWECKRKKDPASLTSNEINKQRQKEKYI